MAAAAGPFGAGSASPVCSELASTSVRSDPPIGSTSGKCSGSIGIDSVLFPALPARVHVALTTRLPGSAFRGTLTVHDATASCPVETFEAAVVTGVTVHPRGPVRARRTSVAEPCDRASDPVTVSSRIVGSDDVTAFEETERTGFAPRSSTRNRSMTRSPCTLLPCLTTPRKALSPAVNSVLKTFVPEPVVLPECHPAPRARVIGTVRSVVAFHAPPVAESCPTTSE